MAKNNIIEVRNLVKKYKKSKVNAVDDISFEVKEGEFFALLGPNGAGKTTTISVLTTTLAKTTGAVNIADFDLDQNPSQVRENIGVIFQNPSLDKNLTAEENIRFHAILYGLYPFRPSFRFMPKAYKNKVRELAKLLGLEKEIFKPIKTYSGGMKRKLEIVRSLIHRPKIIFLDEPTSGLDPISRKSLWEYLMKVRDEEKTTLFLTTHYLEEAEKADRVSIINNGKIVKIGTPSKIKQDLTREILIVDSKKRNTLRDELLKNKTKFIENKHFDIDLKNKNAQKIIQSIKVPLSYLKTHTPTLEEAYLEIIRKEANGNEGN